MSCIVYSSSNRSSARTGISSSSSRSTSAATKRSKSNQNQTKIKQVEHTRKPPLLVIELRPVPVLGSQAVAVDVGGAAVAQQLLSQLLVPDRCYNKK
jgi:hypothetical protein